MARFRDPIITRHNKRAKSPVPTDETVASAVVETQYDLPTMGDTSIGLPGFTAAGEEEEPRLASASLLATGGVEMVIPPSNYDKEE